MTTTTRLTALFVFFLAPVALWAQEPLVNDECAPIKRCVPTKICSQPQIQVDQRQCRQCLLRNPFNSGCQVYGNDPYCEIAKASANGLARLESERKRAECETEQTQEKENCTAQLNGAKLLCEVGRATLANKLPLNDGLSTLLSANVYKTSSPLPMSVINTLVDRKLYDITFLRQVRIRQLDAGSRVPAIFQEAKIGFTVGTDVFLRDSNIPGDIPLRFWVSQIEAAKLYTEYGILETYIALENGSGTLQKLIETKVENVCTAIGCS